MHLLQGHRHAIRALAYAPGDPTTLVSAGDDRTVRVWGLTGAPGVSLAGHRDGMLCLAFAADGSLATGGRAGSLALWDVADLHYRSTYSLHGPVVALAFTDDGLLAALRSQSFADEPGRLVRWPCGPERRAELLSWDGEIESAAFAPGGALVAVASPHRGVELWQIGQPRQPPALWCHSRVRCLAFSPAGDLLAVGTGRFADIYELPGMKLAARCAGHRADVLALAFSPDGQCLLTGGADRSARLWAVTSGRGRAAWDWQVGRVQAVAFSGDGMTAAAGGEKSTVVVWDVDEG